MHTYKEYCGKIAGDKTKERATEDVICNALEKLELHCPELYYKTLYSLHCIAYGPHFDDCLARLAVSKMDNVDGTTGEHWNMEETNRLAEQHGIEHKADYYYTINMLYSDFSQVLGNDSSLYAKLAKAYMCDPDAPKGKVFEVWFSQMSNKEK